MNVSGVFIVVFLELGLRETMIDKIGWFVNMSSVYQNMAY